MYILPSDVFTTENSTVTFECLAIGQPFPVVEWYFKEELVSNLSNTKYSVGNSGREFGALTIFNVMFEDWGRYICKYSNEHGFIEVSAELLVQGIVYCLNKLHYYSVCSSSSYY